MISNNRVVSIGGVILDHTLFISTNEIVTEHIGFENITPSGTLSVFVQNIGSTYKEVTLNSKDNAWLKYDTITKLYALDFKVPHEVVFTDNTTAVYLFNNNKIAINITPTYDGSLWYNVIINLIRG